MADTGTFVARDRARRLGRAIERVRRERLLAWRGAAVGMSALDDKAAPGLEAILEDARASRDDVVEGRLRDRERPLSDVPFAVMAHAVGLRLDLARRIEERSRGRKDPLGEARDAYEALLLACEGRIDAFCVVYDEKRPLGLARPTEVARVLERVETAAAWASTGRAPSPGHRSFDRAPPPFPTDVHGFEDLLLAARFEALPLPGPWRVRPADGPVPFALAIGDDAAPPTATPAPVDRAARVLGFDHAVEVAFAGEPGNLLGIRLRLADVSGGSVSRTAAAATGGETRLSPEAEKAVRALAAAPPIPQEGLAPPQRLVALLGLLRVLDAEIRRVFLARLHGSSVRRAAVDLPRETVRKAPPRKDLLATLERDVPGLPIHRVDGLASEVAAGKIGSRALDAATTATLIALFGRTWTVGALRLDRTLDLGDWTDAEAVECARDLLDVALVRRDLEAGGSPDATRLTRLERATIATLSRLGRIP